MLCGEELVPSMTRSRRLFGSLRQLPSGRWQVRYRDPTGQTISGDVTFVSESEAGSFLSTVEADMVRGAWIDPRAGEISMDAFTVRWLASRRLAPRTRDLYEGLLRKHIVAVLGEVQLGRLTPSAVRTWNADMLAAGRPGEVVVAKCYRLLRSILSSAVEDGLIARNPCVLKGAGVERSPERPVATIPEVYALADAIDPRYRLMVLLATFAGLRLGELFGLERRHIDMLHGVVIVDQQLLELPGRTWLGPPKTDAGRRRVTVPDAMHADIEHHLARWVAVDPGAPMFSRADGSVLTRRFFHRRWVKATDEVGLAPLHFHDLRHTGNTLAAATGASTKELMARMGHASSRAALIYQHATRDRDVAIARALSTLIEGQVEHGVPHEDPASLKAEGLPRTWSW